MAVFFFFPFFPPAASFLFWWFWSVFSPASFPLQIAKCVPGVWTFFLPSSQVLYSSSPYHHFSFFFFPPLCFFRSFFLIPCTRIGCCLPFIFFSFSDVLGMRIESPSGRRNPGRIPLFPSFGVFFFLLNVSASPRYPPSSPAAQRLQPFETLRGFGLPFLGVRCY